MAKIINNVSVISLGCCKNTVDSEYVCGLLKANGYKLVEDVNQADALIINTCGFIKPAKEESINVIYEAIELKKKKKIKKLIVIGCLAQRYGKELRKQIKAVDNFYGVMSFDKILNALKPKVKILDYDRYRITPDHYAYLKISEGCSHTCSFCSIPKIRGKHISRELEDVLADAQTLADDKALKEVNIIAQDTTYYGMDNYQKRILPELLEKLSDMMPDKWLRLLYTFPAGFPVEILDIIAERPNICNYIDIPFQHISSNMLQSMKRGIDRDRTIALIEAIRTRIPEVAIRSAFIVGYPGETDQDFQELYDFISEYKLDRVGVFLYSQEEDTSAFNLGDPIAEYEKEDRRKAIMKLQHDISEELNSQKIGRELKVLIDGIDKEGRLIGRTEQDAPEVDNAVIIEPDESVATGDWATVKITGAEPYDLLGKIVK